LIDVYVNVNYDNFTMPVAAPAAPQTQRDSQRIYSIAELAREFAITARTIRFYEDEGLIKPRRQGLTRLYSVGDRTRLGWILRGKRLGFTLAEIKELLDLYQVDRTGVQQLRELLRRSRLHIDDLQRRRRDLDAQIQEFKDVESHVTAELKKRGVDPEND
jgi:DNA-binding transcriptional MerR regulator